MAHTTARGAPAAPGAGGVFDGTGEMAVRCRAHGWAGTPLGPVEAWPPALRAAARLCLDAGFPTCLYAGDDLVLVYNDAFVEALGRKHPDALGRPAREVWAEVWAQVAPDFERVRSTGAAVLRHDQRFLLHRGADGAAEEAFYTFAFSPVRDEGGVVVGVFNTAAETTARVRGEAALSTERERLRSVILNTPAPLALLEGADYRFTLVNDAYRRVSGGGRDVTGLTPPEAFPELAGRGMYERFDQVYATGEPWVGRETLVRCDRDGTGVRDTWFDLRYEPVRDAEGRVAGILDFAVDVTEQVRARREVERLLAESGRAVAALAESEARFRTVQDASPLGFCIHRPVRDADGAVVDFVTSYINAAGARIVGQPRERVMTERLLAIWPAAGAEGIVADYVRVLETGAPNVRELLYEHEELAAGLTLTAVRIRGGPEAELGITFTDITARLRAERERTRLLAAERAARAAAEAEEQRLAAVIAHLPVGVTFAEAPAGRHSVSNPAAVAIWGIVPASPEVAAYSRDFVGYRPGPGARGSAEEAARRIASHEWPLARALAAGEVVADELAEIERPDGTRRLVSLSAAPVRDAGGRVTGALVTTTDVTEREATLRALEAARQAAEAANRAKGEFLSTMSHELRTPLNAIGGYAELLEMGLRGPVTEEQRRDLGRIQQSQRHLLGLVNEVLDLAKVDAGALRVERAAVRAGDTVDAALALLRPQAAAKSLALSEACEGAADRPYLGDEPRVRQVLVNLLANAVKFTRPGGRVAVTCALTDAPPPGAALAPGTPYVALRVEDTGVGIAEGQRERIFEPFTQAEDGANPYTRPAGGTGLGLAISRRLARVMGGDLTVESAEGRGSAFTLWLPTPERRGAPRVARPAGVSPAARRGAPAPTPADEAAGLVRIGAALAGEAGPAVRAWAARLRADPAIPAGAAAGGQPYTDAELEDHAATFVTDIGLALRALGAGGPEPAALLRDSRAILAAIAERHGGQRAGLGWPEAAVAREYALLAEVLDEAVRRLAGPADAAAAERAAGAVAQFLDQAARLSLGGFRLAAGPDAPPGPRPV